MLKRLSKRERGCWGERKREINRERTSKKRQGPSFKKGE